MQLRHDLLLSLQQSPQFDLALLPVSQLGCSGSGAAAACASFVKQVGVHADCITGVFLHIVCRWLAWLVTVSVLRQLGM
jgi:hypothetical protein